MRRSWSGASRVPGEKKEALAEKRNWDSPQPLYDFTELQDELSPSRTTQERHQRQRTLLGRGAWNDISVLTA